MSTTTTSTYIKTNTEEEDHYFDDDDDDDERGGADSTRNIGHNNTNSNNVVEPLELLASASVDEEEEEGTGFTRGELQEPAYRDKWFGIFFILHLVIMISVGIMYGTGILETTVVENDNDEYEYDNSVNNNNHNYNGNDRNLLLRRLFSKRRRYTLEEEEENDAAVASSSSSWGDDDDDDNFFTNNTAEAFIWLIFVIIIPTGVCIGMMTVMKSHATTLIKCSLFFSIGFNVLLAAIILISPGSDDAIIAAMPPFVFALILICYTKAVWHRIPFAASNIRTAVTVVQSNLGMAMLAIANIPFVATWIVLWGYVCGCVLNSPWFQQQEKIEVYDSQLGQDEPTGITTQGFLAIIGLLLSFYWTIQVFNNIVHTTLCGTVGTWWFIPHEANKCCSRGLVDSLSRSLSYSFGSICLGSLLVAIIETLRSIFRSQARNRRGGGLVTLIAQCLLHFIERIAKYFNKFAFVYVGLYGYSYIDAGKNVLSLFHHRGWSVIISDSLVVRMLLMMSFSVGLVTAGIMVILFWSLDGLLIVGSFFIGFLMSILIFNVLMSAVDSIIVLFAEAPREFYDNHPELAQEMKDSWTQAWPDIFSPVSTTATATATTTTMATVATATVVPSSNYYSDNADSSNKAFPEAAPVSSLV